MTRAADDFGAIAEHVRRLRSAAPEPWRKPSDKRVCPKCMADIAVCGCDSGAVCAEPATGLDPVGVPVAHCCCG